MNTYKPRPRNHNQFYYDESFIIKNADTFDWWSYKFDIEKYSEDFLDRFKDKIQHTFLNGEYHSYKDRPSFVNYDNKIWHKKGLRHRENGPALIHKGGVKQYWLNNKIVVYERKES